MNQADWETLSTPRLVELLGAAQWSARQTAATLLSGRGQAAVEGLMQGLAHPRCRVRAQCVGLLDHLADDRCLAALQSALTDASASVRRQAVHALGCQRCKPAPLALDIVGLLIERSLRDPSIRVRRVAVHQLGLQPSDERAVVALQTILEQDADSKLLSRARFALSTLQGKSATASPAPPTHG